MRAAEATRRERAQNHSIIGVSPYRHARSRKNTNLSGTRRERR